MDAAAYGRFLPKDWQKHDDPPGEVARMSKTTLQPASWAAARCTVFSPDFPRLWEQSHEEESRSSFQFKWKEWVASLDKHMPFAACRALVDVLQHAYGDSLNDLERREKLALDVAKAIIEIENRWSIDLRVTFLRNTANGDPVREAKADDAAVPEKKLMTRIRAAVKDKLKSIGPFVTRALDHFAPCSISPNNIVLTPGAPPVCPLPPAALPLYHPFIDTLAASPPVIIPESAAIAQPTPTESFVPSTPQVGSDEPECHVESIDQVISSSYADTPADIGNDLGNIMATSAGMFVSSPTFDVTAGLESLPPCSRAAYVGNAQSLNLSSLFQMQLQPPRPEPSIIDPLLRSVLVYEDGRYENARRCFVAAIGCSDRTRLINDALGAGLTVWHFVYLRAARYVMSKLAGRSGNLFARLEPLLVYTAEDRHMGKITEKGARTLQQEIDAGNFAAMATYGTLLCYHNMEDTRARAKIGEDLSESKRIHTGLLYIVRAIRRGNLIAPKTLVAIIQDRRKTFDPKVVEEILEKLTQAAAEDDTGVVAYHMGLLLSYENAEYCSYSKDLGRAQMYYENALQSAGLPKKMQCRAHRELGLMHAFSESCEYDFKRAKYYFKLGDDLGDDISTAQLANMMLIERSFEQARNVLQDLLKSDNFAEVYMSAVETDAVSGILVPTKTYRIFVSECPEQFLESVRNGAVDPISLTNAKVKSFGRLVSIEHHMVKGGLCSSRGGPPRGGSVVGCD